MLRLSIFDDTALDRPAVIAMDEATLVHHVTDDTALAESVAQIADSGQRRQRACEIISRACGLPYDPDEPCPHVSISEVPDSPGMRELDRVAQAVVSARLAYDNYLDCLAERDRAIRRAVAKGVNRSHLATAVGMNYQTVYKVTTAPDADE